MASNLIVGLDIGSESIKAVVAENEKGKLVPKLFLKQPSRGVRKGVVVDLAETGQAVGRLISELRHFAKHAPKNIFLNIGTPQIKTQLSRGIVAVSRADNEIFADDISRVVRASQAVNLGSNRTIIHHVTREFIVDGVSDIADPLGLTGSRLEVQSIIIDAFEPHVKSLIRVVELAGGQISGMVFNPLAAARSVLSKRQKDLGVALIDMGAGTTGLAVFEENKLVGVGKCPVGSGHITNDLAIMLKIPVAAAEEVKLKYGYAFSKDVGSKEQIDLQKFSSEAVGMVSKRYVAEIVESRLDEIFKLIYNELKSMGKAGKLPGGAVFVGGGAKMPGLTDFAKQELKLSSRVDAASNEEWGATNESFGEYFDDPEFVSALGLVLWGMDEQSSHSPLFQNGLSIKGVLRYFMP